MTHKTRLALALLLALAPICSALAQEGPAPAAAVPVTGADRTAVVAGLAAVLQANYVFPDVAARVSKALAAKDAKGGYATAGNADTFSDALSKDLRDLGQDAHFRVAYARGYVPRHDTLGDAPPPKEELDAMRREIARVGYGLQRVERLEGNVGYIEVRGFGPTAMVGEAMASAMQLLSGTDAMILDLRRNGGGEPESVAYLLSHFFDAADRRHLNDIYTRPTGKTQQYWTDPAVRTHYTRPVYVLTSGRTFSGGEECAYDLQTQKRAILVGEVTGGGANPGDDFAIGHDFVAFVPTGKSINPVTHTNWEHVGVKPDLAVPAADAQKTAYAAALRTLVAEAKDPDEKAALAGTLHKVETGTLDAPNYSAHQ